MKIVVEISDELASDVNRAIALANNSDPNYSSHGTLGFETLTRMLLEDVAMTVRRPGSWEGANMSQFLASHGYDV
jgi:hypothetical protein